MTSTTGLRTGPTWRTWVPYATAIWALGYGAVRTYWAAGDRPWFLPTGSDLVVFSGWGSVVLCAIAAAVAIGVRSHLGRPRNRLLGWVFVGAGWTAVAGLAAASAMFVLDLVGLLFAGVGIRVDPAAAASRTGCFVGVIALALTTLVGQRRLRNACVYCGRTSHSDRRVDAGPMAVPAPRWALFAGYVAVAGCVAREVAQGIVGYSADSNPLAKGSPLPALTLLVMMTLAGTLLPLALVHNWGQVWPPWTLWLAGRRVPRWLVLGPALLVAGGLTCYFGTNLLQALTDPSDAALPGLPTWFYWVAVPAYLVWGVALGVAALSYSSRTRPACENAHDLSVGHR